MGTWNFTCRNGLESLVGPWRITRDWYMCERSMEERVKMCYPACEVCTVQSEAEYWPGNGTGTLNHGEIYSGK